MRGPYRPSRPFLIALALCGLSGALLLTPASGIATPPITTIAHVARPTTTVLPAPGPLDSAALEREVLTRYRQRPLASLLGRHTRQQGVANRIARAIVKEAQRLQIAPSLLTGVLLTENPQLDADTVSNAGAVGLMQVMHFHAGEFDCGSDDLAQVEANICHGARVFGQYLRRTGDVRRALLRYNGCVASTNTPNCHRYPAKVLRVAHQVRQQILMYPPSRPAVDSAWIATLPTIKVISGD
ncbi:MAG TPA: transglycosylase SLT domain-containing protein [Gemmatimonadales bacterium]